jgi:vesicle transport through interaction with t-SNAREs protein 1
MSIFNAYDQEYTALTKDIVKSMGELKSYPTGSEKIPSLIRHTDALLSQSTDLIKQMEIEVRTQDAGTKRALSERVIEYKKSLATLRSEFERTKEQSQRSSLIGEKSAGDRQRLLNVNDKYAV